MLEKLLYILVSGIHISDFCVKITLIFWQKVACVQQMFLEELPRLLLAQVTSI